MVPSASREVASILTVYDQWWQDARNHFQREMKARATRPADVRHRSLLDESSVGENTSDEDIADNQQSPRSERSTYELRNPGSGQGHHEQPPPRSLVRRCWDFICLPCGKVRTAIKEKSRRIQTIQKTDNLTLEELCVVRSISQRLAAQRSRKFFQTWVSILLFLLSVGGGYLRAVEYYERRKTSQTAHTLAIVMLFSFLLFAVYVNGHVVFANRLPLGHCFQSRGFVVKDGSIMRPPGIAIGKRGAYSGIVNSWRPDKYLRAHDIDDRSIWMLLTVSIFAVICSWVPAFTISYHTPTIGFGCRSLAWTLIVCGWVVNAACDIFGECIKWNKKSRLDFSTAALYYFSYVRDALVTLGVVSAIVTAQLGIMNNCWCRAGVTSSYIETAVEIGPPTDAMRREGSILWLAAALGGLAGIFFVIFYAGLDGENGRLLYVRSQAESMAEQRGIDLEQRWLYSQNQQPHFTAPGEMHPPAQPEEGTSLLNPATASVGYRATSNTSSPSREGSMEREPLVSR
ncbi:uncharacterized protein KY384_001761 [Bacidia gigantensis]|uniref:uncharacterized protein n=1 Tax=Bacidia gigantensis TaxID=2732470 RepID=UPI001D054846|nr:uncharacterized protein KY384_001761 [Bacidia gigantensis]KAG8532979.1 hypothetical protein KY384_001761 [Bacidia gigantensis]